MKNTMRKAMLSTIAMLVVAVMSLTGVTYAWFSASDTAKVEGMSMNVGSADGGLQVSKDKGTWSSSVNFDANFDPNNETGMMPVSTINGTDFFLGEVNDADLTEIKTVADGSATVAPVNVWSNTFYVKNTGYSDITVSLDADAAVFTDTDETVKNSAAAARVAVFVGKGDATPTLAYIYGSDAETYNGVKGASGNDYFTAANDTTYTGAVLNYKTTKTDCTFDLDGLTDAGAEEIYTVIVKVWVEGQDAQCINANAASTFDVALNLKATPKAN